MAWDEEQEARLPDLRRRRRPTAADAEVVDADEVRRREPHLGPGARSGLLVPGEWAIDPWSVTLALATEAVRPGPTCAWPPRSGGSTVADNGHEIRVPGGVVRARWLVNAAGLGPTRSTGCSTGTTSW